MTQLPNWLMPMFNAGQVRAADAYAIDEMGIPGRSLMERAAEALAETVFDAAPDGRVLVVVGKGNNGGDGLAAARLLRERGREVDVRATCGLSDWQGDAALMLAQLTGEPPTDLSGGLDAYSCVVDCILGTGATGPPHGPALEGIQLVNAVRANGAVAVACDVPSGVDASTGEIAGDSVKADFTVTFHAMKPGLWIRPGKGRAGQTAAADIGIPSEATGQATVGLITAGVANGLPRRVEGDDKFAAGSVLVAGGSPGLTGAPMLSALGAARAGAGYVTAALPASLLSASDAVPEIMGLGLAEADGAHSIAGMAELIGRLGAGRSLVVGPGLGRSEAAREAARNLVANATGPVVVDADALNAFADEPEAFAQSKAELVLTPHAGEMAALLGLSRDEVEASRLASAQTLAKASAATVVLKGDDSLVVHPNGLVAVSGGDSPALATAGSGDVLSGAIGALLAKGVESFHAACAGVRLHLEAGRIASEHGIEGVIAGDIAQALPAARKRLESLGR